ncbi:MAG: helix-turn-helix transcriptional regulator [Clostridia bacterium]|nr:helix-turn-helix transcriptional regulator [Clostridia bacterium]
MKTKKQINIEIGERIKNSRETKGITQEQLAELIDVSPQYISDLERGVVGASLETIKKICLVLTVSCDYLFFGENNDIYLTSLNAKITPLNEKQRKCLMNIIDCFIDATD